jgi:hypothetical protein
VTLRVPTRDCHGCVDVMRAPPEAASAVRGARSSTTAPPPPHRTSLLLNVSTSASPIVAADLPLDAVLLARIGLLLRYTRFRIAHWCCVRNL